MKLVFDHPIISFLALFSSICTIVGLMRDWPLGAAIAFAVALLCVACLFAFKVLPLRIDRTAYDPNLAVQTQPRQPEQRRPSPAPVRNWQKIIPADRLPNQGYYSQAFVELCRGELVRMDQEVADICEDFQRWLNF